MIIFSKYESIGFFYSEANAINTLGSQSDRSPNFIATLFGVYYHHEFQTSVLLLSRRRIKIEILSSKGGHLVYEWKVGSTRARAHACAGDNLVCVHMINGSPMVL